MSIDMTGWSQSKKTKYSMLKRAFDAYEGWNAILLIQWRVAAERHKHDADVLAAARAFNIENEGQPQAVRALNLLCEREGLAGIYQYNTELDASQPVDSDIMLDVQEKDPDAFFDEMEDMSRRERRSFKLN